jgi:hypothetical protein
MRCGRFREWLREITAYPTPGKIAEHLRVELAAAEEAPVVADESPRRRHLQRCGRCRERVRRALTYWSLLALYARDVTPGADLELRVGARIRAAAAAGEGPGLAGPLEIPRPRLREAVAATEEEQQLYAEAGGVGVPVGWLRVLVGPGGGEDAPLYPGETVLGRDPSCDVVFEEASVAPRHASIVCAVSPAGGQYFLLDHGAGRTVVNRGDEPVGWIRLHDNDVIELGDVLLKFKVLAGVRAG